MLVSVISTLLAPDSGSTRRIWPVFDSRIIRLSGRNAIEIGWNEVLPVCARVITSSSLKPASESGPTAAASETVAGSETAPSASVTV